MRRVGTAHHYRVCADTPYSRSKGEEWIDRMITQGFFPSPTLRKGRRMGHPCERLPGSAGASPSHTTTVCKQPAVSVTDPVQPVETPALHDQVPMTSRPKRC
jgi:hypothetical protein